MIKSVSEAVQTVEERQGVPSEKALKGHVAHLVTRLRFKGHRSALRIRPKRSTVGSVQLSDVELKTEGTTRASAHGDLVQHKTVLLEIFDSCSSLVGGRAAGGSPHSASNSSAVDIT